MRYKKDVFRALALITQLGVAVMAPIFLCVAVGLFLKNRFSFDIVFILLIIGILAGGRNAYILAKSAIDDSGKKGEKND